MLFIDVNIVLYELSTIWTHDFTWRDSSDNFADIRRRLDNVARDPDTSLRQITTALEVKLDYSTTSDTTAGGSLHRSLDPIGKFEKGRETTEM